MNGTTAPHTTTGTAASPYDRRREERIAVSIPMRLIYKGAAGEVHVNATCTDLSESGLAFQSATPLYVGELVMVQFQQSEAGDFRCLVRLLYKNHDHYGGYFTLPG